MGVRAKSRTKYAVIQQGQNRQSNDQHGQLKQSAHSAPAKTKRHNIYRRNSAKRLESCAAERMTEGSAHWPVVVAVFLVSATAAAVPNHEGNAGAKVAEAAGQVDRQVDDTQAVCTDIRELILEQKNLAQCRPTRTPTSPPAATTRSSNTHRPTHCPTIRATWRCRQASDV